jgi:hypothetical protein
MLRLLGTLALILWIVLGVTELVSLAPPATTASPKISEQSSAQNNTSDDTNARPVILILRSFGVAVHLYKDEITAISTALLAIITGALVLIARNQYRTTHAQLRAYLFADIVTVANFTTSPKINVNFKNCGQTPAYKINVRTNTFVGPLSLLKEPEVEATAGTGGHHLGPGSQFHWVCVPDKPITPDEIQSVMDRSAALYIYGIAKYRDAFRKNRTLKFCCRRGGPDDPLQDGVLAIYEDWNEAN